MHAQGQKARPSRPQHLVPALVSKFNFGNVRKARDNCMGLGLGISSLNFLNTTKQQSQLGQHGPQLTLQHTAATNYKF